MNLATKNVLMMLEIVVERRDYYTINNILTLLDIDFQVQTWLVIAIAVLVCHQSSSI